MTECYAGQEVETTLLDRERNQWLYRRKGDERLWRTVELCGFDQDFTKPLVKFLADLTALLETVPAEYRHAVVADFRPGDDDERGHLRMSYWARETDEEFASRQSREAAEAAREAKKRESEKAQRARAAEERDKAEYARLKAKFEPPV